MTPPQERDFFIGPHRVHAYVRALPGGERTIVLVHGIGVSSRYNIPLFNELAHDFSVVSIDMPGFGKSSRPQEILTMQNYAWILGECIKQMQLENPVIVGHSMGCQVVAEALKENPNLTDKAVLMGPTVDTNHRGVLHHIIALLRECGREPWRLNRVVLRDYWRCGIRRYMQTLGPMLADRIEEKLTNTKTDVLVMRGERDIIVPHEWIVRLGSMIPGSKLAEVAGAAHVLQFTHAAVTARLIREFVRA